MSDQISLFGTIGMTRCRLTLTSNVIAVHTPYDQNFVADLKHVVPFQHRRWDGTAKAWLVDPKYGAQVQQLCQTYFNETPELPTATAVKVAPEIKLVRLEYLGACKVRDDGTVTATGFADNAWSLVFPEAVLKTWFKADAQQAVPGQPVQPDTLYSTLAVAPSVSADDLKASYRRLVRQWHPDVCREPDASERFKAIQHAWDVLREPKTRKRYDAGLAFQRSLTQPPMTRHSVAISAANRPQPFRAPLRCGLVLVNGTPGLSFTVSQIVSWDDITRADGKVLVSSWDSERQTIRKEWV